MGKPDDKYTVEIDYIENGFDVVIKNGKKIQKLSTDNNKRFSQFQQSGVTAQNRNEALARARASKATEKANKVAAAAATKTAKSTAKTIPIAAAASKGFGAGGISSLAPNLPQAPFTVPPAHQLTGAGKTPDSRTSNIDWIPTGSTQFKPAAKKGAPPVQTTLQKFNGGMKKANMALFKMQMASLGVYFSFMSIGMAITGLFTSLQNLGGVFKSGALGKAFGGVDVTGAMGVDPAQLVQGWKNITGIMGMMQSAISGLAAAALTPEVMAAVKDMFLTLGKTLSDGKVATALGDIIISFTKLVTVICESGLLTGLASLISFLGDTGLLVPIIGLILGAQYLLAGLSALGFVMQGITLLTTLYTWAMGLTAASIGATLIALGTWLAIIGLVLLAFDFVINLFENFQKTGWSVATLVNALWDTFADLYNVLLPIMNLVGGAFGMEQRAAFSTNSGGSTAVQNNYNFNGNYDDPSALIKKAQSAKNTTY